MRKQQNQPVSKKRLGTPIKVKQGFSVQTIIDDDEDDEMI